VVWETLICILFYTVRTYRVHAPCGWHEEESRRTKRLHSIFLIFKFRRSIGIFQCSVLLTCYFLNIADMCVKLSVVTWNFSILEE
jgi:hypothetical protein